MSIGTLKSGQVVQLEVSGAAFTSKAGAVHGGEGNAVARLNGVVIFVQGGVPGDVVRAKVIRTRRNHAEASVVEVLQPSSFRTSPRCIHFGTCGGCKWQHVDYQAQLTFKRQHVLDSFQRIGGFDSFEVPPVIGADDIYFYRNKMEFSFSDQEWLEEFQKSNIEDQKAPIGRRTRRDSGATIQEDNSKPVTRNPEPSIFLGLHVPQRYDKVLDIRECHLQSEASNLILNFVRDYARRKNLAVYSSETNQGYLRFLVIRQSKRTGELMVNIVTFDDRPDTMASFTRELREAVPAITTVVNTINSRKAQVAFGEEERVYYGDGVIHERLGKYTFSISAGSFFQTNTIQAEKLYTVAKEFAQLKSSDTVFDLYSGTGTIAIFISDAAASVVGIESVGSSIRDAERNVRLNGIRNCSFVAGDLKNRLTEDVRWMESHSRPNILLIDPPRSGMHPAVVEEILKMKVPRIVYVSCNTATQARDAKLLAKEYTLLKLQAVDMFPHTYHIENVALFELR